MSEYDGPQCFIIPGNHGLLTFLISLHFTLFLMYLINYAWNVIYVRVEFLIYDLFFITDWFDGLHTFMRYICHKSWLGGWFLPQKKSYFALQLPKGWWIFGLDLSLHGDVDVYQFKFFADLCRNKVHFSSLACPFPIW